MYYKCYLHHLAQLLRFVLLQQLKHNTQLALIYLQQNFPHRGNYANQSEYVPEAKKQYNKSRPNYGDC